MIYNADEQKRLAEIVNEKGDLETRRHGLKDRENFISLVKDRAKKIAGELGAKDICGFDSRLSWSEEEFLEWRDSDEGQLAFSRGLLRPQPTDNVGGDDAADDSQKAGDGMCQKKKCERHKAWKHLQMHDIRFEEVSIAERIGGLKQEEKSIRERAKLRAIKESDGDREGKVEVIDDDDGLE